MYCSNCGKEVLAQANFCRACGAKQTERDPRRPPPLPHSPVVETPQALSSAAVGSAAAVYAAFGRRVGAFLLDVVIVVPLAFLIGLLAAKLIGESEQQTWSSLELAGVIWLYYAFFESSRWQATLGKRALRIKVTSGAGERIGFGRALVRSVGQSLSHLLLGFGFLMAAFTPRRQALHDYIAGTVVTQQSATPAEIAQSPTAPAGNNVLVAALCFVGLIAIIGILAAIAIPAYQNYTIRAQVSDALMHAESYKVAVVDAMANNTTPELITTAVGGDLRLPVGEVGPYAESIDVTDGTVVITYGRQANPKLKGRRLALSPVQLNTGDVLWVCGLARPPVGYERVGAQMAQRITDVSPSFLPAACHS